MSDNRDQASTDGASKTAIDETQPAEASRPAEQAVVLSMRELAQLHPRFWVSVWSDPQLSAEAEDLALEIVGKDPFIGVLALTSDSAAPTDILALARDVAEAQVNQRRVRRVRFELEQSLSSQKFHGGPPTFADLLVAARRHPRTPPAQVILAIDCYDRCVRAHHRKASRAFDAIVRRDRNVVFRLISRLQRRADLAAAKKANAV
jgi:hypothetical protein